MNTTTSWKVWKTIKIGTGAKSGINLNDALLKSGFEVHQWAHHVLFHEAFPVAATATDVDLVIVKVVDLGFEKGAPYDRLCVRAVERGLELCPAEVGPQLRLQYPDQPRDEWLIIAMKAIPGWRDTPEIFGVEHVSDGMRLSACPGYPALDWYEATKLVFRLPRESA